MKHILTDSEISKRAYEIYLKQGGNASDNWFQAKLELLGELKILNNKLETQEEHDRFIKDILWPNWKD